MLRAGMVVVVVLAAHQPRVAAQVHQRVTDFSLYQIRGAGPYLETNKKELPNIS